MNNPTSIMIKAQQHAEDNLQQGCRELLEWQETSLLCDGVVRETARILEPIESFKSLNLAERLYERAAIRKVALGL